MADRSSVGGGFNSLAISDDDGRELYYWTTENRNNPVNATNLCTGTASFVPVNLVVRSVIDLFS